MNSASVPRMALEGKVVAVTGATRGIGRAIADAMLTAGAAVAISGRSELKGRQALEEMGQPDRTLFVAGDARDQSDVEGFVDATVAAFGPVDILVNNAGGAQGHALIGDMTDEAWHEANDWILNSAFWASRRVLNPMKERGWGRIINVSSLRSKYMATPMASHYAANKAALNTFSRAIAIEYGRFGITSNAIVSGAVETDLMRDAGQANAKATGTKYEDFLENFNQLTLTGRINTVGEIAAVAMLLASPQGAGITGSAINVDAGVSPW